MPGPQATCDDNLAVDDLDPIHAANAVDICKPLTDPKLWGLKSAKWVLPDGSATSTLVPLFTTQQQALANYDLGHGILPAFGPGVHVQAGQRMLALSSGTAREPTDPGYVNVSGFDKSYKSASPMGFPKPLAACAGLVTAEAHDAVALQVEIVAPTNAHGFSFDFDFFTYDWPLYICSPQNDPFLALLLPYPFGQTNGNIAYDGMGDPITANSAFIGVCGCPTPPCTAGNKSYACALGDQALVGTGFGKDTPGYDHGSTYWLKTTAPLQPHEDFTVRWVVYDSSNGSFDTTVLIDNFAWIVEPGVAVGTKPQPSPK
jgi:hypothetical protein